MDTRPAKAAFVGAEPARTAFAIMGPAIAAPASGPSLAFNRTIRRTDSPLCPAQCTGPPRRSRWYWYTHLKNYHFGALSTHRPTCSRGRTSAFLRFGWADLKGSGGGRASRPLLCHYNSDRFLIDSEATHNGPHSTRGRGRLFNESGGRSYPRRWRRSTKRGSACTRFLRTSGCLFCNWTR